VTTSPGPDAEAGSDVSPAALRIIRALQRYGQDASRLGHAFSVLHDLQPPDLRALVAIVEAEAAGAPLTPGRLREHLRLSSGGTSVVIDRLERAGHVERVRDHPGDHRVVHLRQTSQGVATAFGFFGPLAARTQALADTFDPAEQEVVARFLDGAATALHDHLDALDRSAGQRR
jgi:DNA-binding MarR family transcriptional regulator